MTNPCNGDFRSNSGINQDSRFDIFNINLPNLDYKVILASKPEVVQYIDKLHKVIEIQGQALSKIRNALSNPTDADEDVFYSSSYEETAITPPTNNIWLPPAGNAPQITITAQVTEAARHGMLGTNFAYEPVSGMYYDYASGYYYDPDLCLYYDGNSGCYYMYDRNDGQYKFHSHISSHQAKQQLAIQNMEIAPGDGEEVTAPVFANGNANGNGVNSAVKQSQALVQKFDQELIQLYKSTKRSKSKTRHSPEWEEGECSESDTSSEYSVDALIDAIGAGHPAMRVIVRESNNSRIKVGTLFLVTCRGGTLGREGDHEILLPDINISKTHLKITYAKYSKIYYVVDLASRNGTLLNGERIAVDGTQSSSPLELPHGSCLQVGGIKLLCHIHLGDATCRECEPGIAQSEWSSAPVLPIVQEPVRTRSDLRTQHKKELIRIRKQYGLGMGSELSNKISNPSTTYLDRAQSRRDTVGVDSLHAKTEMASVQQSISSENKGFKLLSKMGWSSGEGLGIDGRGTKEPVPLVNNPGTSGLGMSMPDLPQPDEATELRRSKWKKAQKRYSQCSSSAHVRPWNKEQEEDSED